MRFPPVVLFVSIVCAVGSGVLGTLRAENWPAWRGLEGNGITKEIDLPLEWSETRNVRWKTALPERGNSTPIIWGDRVFVTQSAGAQRLIICFRRDNGQIIWQKGPTYSEAELSHPTNPPCSGSPTTDGERVMAWFGSAGLYCFDLDGKELWHADLGKQDHEWGYAGSPVIEGDLCLLNFGPGSRSFLVALDKRTGKEVWRKEEAPIKPAERTDGFAGKDGVIGSWSTPLLVRTATRSELVMSWPGKLVAYEPSSGKELWTCAGLNPLIYTSPMFGEGVVLGSGGFGGTTIAVEPGGTGDVSGKRLWQKIRDKQRIGSGVISGGHLYILNTPGTAQCLDLKTGETKWEERLKGPSGRSESWSSMVLSGERIYVLNQAGDTFVIKASPQFEKLAVNSLNDGLTNSSVAISNGDIFIRTQQHLWCIGTVR